jgi:hypothetical protein
MVGQDGLFQRGWKENGLTAGPLLKIKASPTSFNKLHQTNEEVRA